jgi:hypothetical protein
MPARLFLTVAAAMLVACGRGGPALRVDHVTLCVPALEAAREAFAAAGIVTEYGGKHANGISEMALSAFADGSYLELIAPQSGADGAAHYWGEFMTRQAGPCGWALRTTDLEGDTRRLTQAGVAAERQSGGRRRPDGTELRWQTVTVGPPPQGSFFPFLIYDETDRNLRAYPRGRPTMDTIEGVLFAVTAVRDLESAVSRYRQAFALGEPRVQEYTAWDARLAWFPGTPVVLAAPKGAGWLTQRLEQFGEIPCAFVLAAPGSWPGQPAEWFGRSFRWLDLGGMRVGAAGA